MPYDPYLNFYVLMNLEGMLFDAMSSVPYFVCFNEILGLYSFNLVICTLFCAFMKL